MCSGSGTWKKYEGYGCHETEERGQDGMHGHNTSNYAERSAKGVGGVQCPVISAVTFVLNFVIIFTELNWQNLDFFFSFFSICGNDHKSLTTPYR